MTAQATVQVQPPAPVQTRPETNPHWLRSLLRQPLGLLALIYLVLLVAVGFLAPVLAPYPPDKQDLTQVLSGPTADHLLGTDSLARTSSAGCFTASCRHCRTP